MEVVCGHTDSEAQGLKALSPDPSSEIGGSNVKTVFISLLMVNF